MKPFSKILPYISGATLFLTLQLSQESILSLAVLLPVLATDNERTRYRLFLVTL